MPPKNRLLALAATTLAVATAATCAVVVDGRPAQASSGVVAAHELRADTSAPRSSAAAASSRPASSTPSSRTSARTAQHRPASVQQRPATDGGATTSATTTAKAPFIGTLATKYDTAAKEANAGLSGAMLEVSWKLFEPQRRVVDKSYASWVLTQFRALRKAGMHVTLGLGLHMTPKWVLDTPANHLRNQAGKLSSQADFVFNRQVRIAAVWYLQQLNKVVPLKYFSNVRVTSGGDAELMFPSADYWAYSAGAQQGGHRPTSLAKNPRPGWKPTDKATEAQRRQWAHWYVGALADVADWQMSAVHALGFRGRYQLVMPGQGLRTKQWNKLMREGYGKGELGRGTAWAVLLQHLRHRANVTAYVSSLADGTADSSVCTPDDDKVAITDPQTFYWSAARWITRLAHEYGMTVAGEPAGYPRSASGQKHYRDTSGSGLLAIAMRQAKACGLLGVYWAHDTQVQNGTMPLSALAKYAQK